MKKFAIILTALLWSSLAFAQSSPGLITGQKPTAAQWNSYFAAKQDFLGYTALNKGGDIMLGVLRFGGGAAPTLTGCGTSPSVSGNNQTGTVTMGTGSPTGCTITFANAYPVTPDCTVTWHANLASMGYTPAPGSITLTQTATSSNKVTYFCGGRQ